MTTADKTTPEQDIGVLFTLSDGPVPSSDVSALCDFGVLYGNARLMRPMPIQPEHVVALAIAAVLPFVPLVFLVMPAQEVLETLGRLLM